MSDPDQIRALKQQLEDTRLKLQEAQLAYRGLMHESLHLSRTVEYLQAVLAKNQITLDADDPAAHRASDHASVRFPDGSWW